MLCFIIKLFIPFVSISQIYIEESHVIALLYLLLSTELCLNKVVVSVLWYIRQTYFAENNRNGDVKIVIHLLLIS